MKTLMPWYKQKNYQNRKTEQKIAYILIYDICYQEIDKISVLLQTDLAHKIRLFEP